MQNRSGYIIMYMFVLDFFLHLQNGKVCEKHEKNGSVNITSNGLEINGKENYFLFSFSHKNTRL